MFQKPPSMADHAIAIVEALDVPVFPAKITKNGQKMSHRSQKKSGTKWGQTKDPERIRKDHKVLGNAFLIGIATGETTERDGETYSLVVIDVDEKDGGASGVENWAKLKAYNFGDPIKTPIAKTTSGNGRHIYLLVPADVAVRNSVGEFGEAELGVETTAIDVRGDGGMVIAPPSINPNNLKGYEWEVSPFDVPVMIAPEWVVEELRRIEAGRGKSKGKGESKKKVSKGQSDRVQLLRDMGVKGKGHDAVFAFSNHCAGKGYPIGIVRSVVEACVHTYDDHCKGLIVDAYKKFAREKPPSQLERYAIVDGRFYDRHAQKFRTDAEIWKLTIDEEMVYADEKGITDCKPGKESRLGWLAKHLPQFDGTVFDPLGDEIVENPKERPSGRYLNTFRPLRSIPYEGREPKPWLDHLARIVPDAGDRDWVLEWLAFVVQNPGRKVNWAPVFIGEEGSGKDTLFRPLAEWFGNYLHPSVKLRDVTHNFNAWQHETIVGIVQERDGGRFQTKEDQAEALKNLLAAPPDHVTLELKGKDAVMIPNIVNVAFFVNSADALAMGRKGRRYFPVEGTWAPADEKEAAAYFGPLHTYLDNGGCDEVIGYLQAYPIKRVKEHMHVPRASAFDRIVDQGLGPVGEALLEEFEERDWVTVAEAAYHVSTLTENRNVVAKALKEIGFQRVHVEGGDSKGRLQWREDGGRVSHVIYARCPARCDTKAIKAKLKEGEA